MEIDLNSFNTDGMFLENKKAITGLSDFIEHARFIEEYYDENCWYRGQPNEEYDLTPGIYRAADLSSSDAEDLKSSFILRAKSYGVKYDYNNIWDWYQIMQHHGIPTRLLDWSEGYLIALYFAVRNPKEGINPTVWAFPPHKFNKTSSNDDGIFYSDKITRDTDDEIVDKYINDRDINLPKYPICIYPAHVNPRMQAQRSCFTVHGKLKNGIEELLKENKTLKFTKLTIDSESSFDVKDELFSAGISESTLFPDLDGLARELRFDYGID